MKIYECTKCGQWDSAMFTVYGDKEVKFCPYCGSDQHLCQIKSGKKEDYEQTIGNIPCNNNHQ